MLNEIIIMSWEKNALEWVKIIEDGKITSRKYTNPAIVNYVLEDKPLKVLDLGCGEGWLIRELSKSGILGTGLDASSVLIENARKKSDQNFLNISYEQLIAGKDIPEKPFDAIVFNFSLFLKEETETLLKILKNNLNKEGNIFIQSIHPGYLIKNTLLHESQWIDDIWSGLDGNFQGTHRWYIRTFADWNTLFNSCELIMEKLIEPVNDDLQPASVIFKLKPLVL